MMKDNYVSYENALAVTSLQSLSHLCKKFALKCTKNPKTADMFPQNIKSQYDTRKPEKFYVTPARTNRLANSAIPHMQRLLNA